MRLTHLLIVGVLAISTVHAQYQVYIGDRDQQSGVYLFDPSVNSQSVFGACAQSGTYRYYYGLEIDRRTGHLWACDIAARQIVRLDRSGNCLGTYPIPDTIQGIPTGLSIHPSGLFLHVTFQNNLIATFSTQLGTFVGTQSIQGAEALYGLQWSPTGRLLYVCDWSGRKIYMLRPAVYPPTNFQVVSTLDTPTNLPARTPNDVAVLHTHSPTYPQLIFDVLFVTLTQDAGFSTSVSYIASVGVLYPNEAWGSWGTIFAHPQNGNRASFFGITYEASDHTLWVSDYGRGELYQVDLTNNPPSITLRTTFPGPLGANKLGLGIDTYLSCATAPRCPEDVNRDGVIDDADLLAVLFAFGTSCP